MRTCSATAIGLVKVFLSHNFKFEFKERLAIGLQQPPIAVEDQKAAETSGE